jgi:hypothetical protein
MRSRSNTVHKKIPLCLESRRNAIILLLSFGFADKFVRSIDLFGFLGLLHSSGDGDGKIILHWPYAFQFEADNFDCIALVSIIVRCDVVIAPFLVFCCEPDAVREISRSCPHSWVLAISLTSLQRRMWLMAPPNKGVSCWMTLSVPAYHFCWRCLR